METIIFLFYLMIITGVKLLIQGFFLIHRLQQLGYYNLKFIKWLEGKQYREILLWNIFELLLPLLIIYILFFSIQKIPNIKFITVYKYITSSLMMIVFTWKVVHPFIAGWVGPKARKKAKIPLKYTSRVKRLIFTFILVIIIMLVLVFYLTAHPLVNFTRTGWEFFQFNSFLLLISVITPILVLIANMINTPVESFIRLWYFIKAKNKIKKSDLIKIAITGSYGKTSTKFFLSAILMEKYKTIFTPASYNTPMGISKVINNNKINEYECFVVEMGADHKGDINVLCKLVKPDFGILTAIDIQHLETFGTLENIVDTKFSLLQNIEKNGFGVYNFDSVIINKNKAKYNFPVKLYSYSIEEENFENVDIIAKDIKHTRKGLSFKAESKEGDIINVQTDILGKHNALNLLAAILTAKKLGLTNTEIEKGIGNIKPVEHRLEKIDSLGGALILDDAFNANLTGACEALKVLHEIEGNKKIIVTPGLVELGEKEDEINKIFGNNIAEYADIAVLIGKTRTKSIYEGIIDKKFNIENLYVVNSLNESKDILKKIIKSGDVVLFENDLPDTFNE